ncbi:uncharacterized protein LY89DRAFT_734497 [Mollisia scopiformis]|uniref:Zn(2)-C6 fungal-type domain-containing protein n=1 Tax=Mollisia scopiformis TaxID=149040 RepID=A0A194X8A8_MOLSC|nr:uncharacterized protein LY89DRAFT_734497 [Mollisia scopiformis]KUJ16401.1 hypothetical protein LY89DRAFT_734497 [Mollisia scopiformis]
MPLDSGRALLPTCNRCRTRRIKCDGTLPACANCAKINFSCQFVDSVLQETIPRSYIKNLYDRIDELNSLLSMQKSQETAKDGFPDRIVLPGEGLFGHHTIPSRNGQSHYLGPSPPALSAFSVVSSLVSTNTVLDPPTILSETDDIHDIPDVSKTDRSMISPNVVRILLAHYDRCISPAYPVISSTFTADAETALKRPQDPAKFRVLIASGIAATHKSYHDTRWTVIARLCRHWAGELAASIIELRDAESVEVLILLLVYELADPERCIAFELLDFATRLCLELGWHRIEKIDGLEDISEEEVDNNRDNLSDCDKRRLMSVLRSADRQLRLIFQRPSMLSGCQTSTTLESMMVFNTYIEIVSAISCLPSAGSCPVSGYLLSLLAMLNDFPQEDPLVSECWLLLLPVCVAHSRSNIYCTQTCNIDISILQSKVLQAATSMLNAVHPVVSSSEAFIPPFIAASKAFSAGCALITGIKGNWESAENITGSLLKCSEILTFSASLWQGGKDYYEVWRKIVAVV